MPKKAEQLFNNNNRLKNYRFIKKKKHVTSECAVCIVTYQQLSIARYQVGICDIKQLL